MRSSAGSASSTRRLAAGLGLLATLTLVACPSDPQNTPTKVEDPKAFDRPSTEPKPRDPDSPFRDPATEPPAGREGTQVTKAEIDAILVAATAMREGGNTFEEWVQLDKCANKTPASARCDGAMGLWMAATKNRRAAGQYYLIEASKLDDPDADAELYAAVAEALRAQGLIAEASQAQEKAVARDGSALRRFQLGRLLSLQPERLSEAAEFIAGARAEDDKLEWLYEEAIVRGQIPTREDAKLAADLFEAYVARVVALPEGDPAKIDTSTVVTRIAELRGLEKVYPTAKEYEKLKAELAPTSSVPPTPPS
jgi:tetratricopeptide (TPR) repeat protein